MPVATLNIPPLTVPIGNPKIRDIDSRWMTPIILTGEINMLND